MPRGGYITIGPSRWAPGEGPRKLAQVLMEEIAAVGSRVEPAAAAYTAQVLAEYADSVPYHIGVWVNYVRGSDGRGAWEAGLVAHDAVVPDPGTRTETTEPEPDQGTSAASGSAATASADEVSSDGDAGLYLWREYGSGENYVVGGFRPQELSEDGSEGDAYPYAEVGADYEEGAEGEPASEEAAENWNDVEDEDSGDDLDLGEEDDATEEPDDEAEEADGGGTGDIWYDELLLCRRSPYLCRNAEAPVDLQIDAMIIDLLDMATDGNAEDFSRTEPVRLRLVVL